VRLLGRQKMSAGGGEYVGPPVPSRDDQQDAEQNRLWGEKSETLLSGNVSAQAICVAA